MLSERKLWRRVTQPLARRFIPRVIEEAYKQLGWSTVTQRALDVRCGAGLSTRAQECVAKESIGIEPSEAMLKWSAVVAPEADFAVGMADAIPICDHSVDLLTAAGSLNYVNLDLFFPEAARVLRPLGALIIYDFMPGRRFRLDRTRLWVSDAELPTLRDRNKLTPHFYIDYILTETNVAAAVRNGVHLEEIRSWCAETLDPIWNGSEQEVLFRGYFACMTKTSDIARR